MIPPINYLKDGHAINLSGLMVTSAMVVIPPEGYVLNARRRSSACNAQLRATKTNHHATIVRWPEYMGFGC